MNVGGLSENERVHGWCDRLPRDHLERYGERLKREHSFPTLEQGLETEQKASLMEVFASEDRTPHI